ncbi:MAG: right-handed parallel beta-helix repeat-containing protein, partial [Paracoccaceae bacterium]|nr:right-handed parallel beta-helix repeat-containing protein [Paracoccaceae bacterium]
PLLPGCYLQIKVRIKAISGNFPSIRVAGWAGGAGNFHVSGLTETASAVALDSYGKVVEVSAIVGTGTRTGVDMAWGPEALYGHFGLDLTGVNGGIVRIDDIEIEDVTHYFHRDMMGWVDVRDYGAVGDGINDDTAAFLAADDAANGRDVLIPTGVFYLEQNVSLTNRAVFHETVLMPDDAILSLTKNYDLPNYIDAFGDEAQAFKKAFQALLNSSGHESLDLGGRRIELSEPLNLQAAVPNRTSYATRRVIRNGQFYTKDSSTWESEDVTSLAAYTASNPYQLTAVANVANIPVGAIVTGTGVGREVYVREVNVGAGTLTLSLPLYDAEGSQNFTFTRHKYLLDFSGFDSISKFVVEGIEFQCSGRASGILLAPAGIAFAVKDCYLTRPKDRGISSPGEGCQGLMVDRCQFLSDESPVKVQDRVSIALNAAGNDVKIRDNRCVHTRHFAILAGSGNLISGNHWFHGDNEAAGIRDAGLVITQTNCKSTIDGNYIDNNFVEWSNEHDPYPEQSNEFSFGGLTIGDNIFTCNDVAPWFNFIVIKPHGADHFIHGLNVTGNVFRTLNGSIDRVEAIDTSFSDLNFDRMRNVVFQGNTFNTIDNDVFNPLIIHHDQLSAATTWTVETAGQLPFNGYARRVTAMMPDGPISNGSGGVNFSLPYASTKQGSDKGDINLTWSEATRGKVSVTVRMDNPL